MQLRFEIALRCSVSALSNALRAFWMRFGDCARSTAFACAFGRDAKDITGHRGANWRTEPLWHGGPTWDQIPALARPDDPATEGDPGGRDREKARTHKAVHVHQVVGWLVGLSVGWLVGWVGGWVGRWAGVGRWVGWAMRGPRSQV